MIPNLSGNLLVGGTGKQANQPSERAGKKSCPNPNRNAAHGDGKSRSGRRAEPKRRFE